MANLKEAIKKHYGSLAAGSSCCGSDLSCCSESDARSEGGHNRNAVHDVSTNGLGCGLPLKYAGLKTGEVVLDLGSGAGAEVLAAARNVGPEGRVIGVDMTGEMIEIARSRALKAGLVNVEFVLADIEALPVESASVDVIISNCVINLAPDKRKVFGEMFRVLKSGGRFVVSDMVTRGRLPSSVQEDPELWAACVAGALEKDRYLNLIGEAGFRSVQVKASTDTGSFSGSDCRLLSITVEGIKPSGYTLPKYATETPKTVPSSGSTRDDA